MQLLKTGRVYWITGLSGAGKTTLCNKLVSYLRSLDHSVVMLDGDALREIMGTTLDAHTREERLELAIRYAHLCQLLSSQGVDVAIATISLFHEVHARNRKNIADYVEIFLDVPMKEVERRDTKQIYSRASSGALKNVAGVDFAVEMPKDPEVHIRWEDGLTVDMTLDQIIEQIKL